MKVTGQIIVDASSRVHIRLDPTYHKLPPGTYDIQTFQPEGDEAYQLVEAMQDLIRTNQQSGHTEEVQNAMLIAMALLKLGKKVDSLEFTIRQAHIENRDRK